MFEILRQNYKSQMTAKLADVNMMDTHREIKPDFKLKSPHFITV